MDTKWTLYAEVSFLYNSGIFGIKCNKIQINSV